MRFSSIIGSDSAATVVPSGSTPKEASSATAVAVNAILAIAAAMPTLHTFLKCRNFIVPPLPIVTYF